MSSRNNLSDWFNGGVTLPLHIRTTRVFHYLGAELGWRQVHHHGSIDDPDLLRAYQTAVTSA
ncbi:MAG: hypothetical protein H6662_11830 [Ardenticatenaceae bacterium]|nr:hypothetical protein [Anaerolineales bacterium]MCB8922265.1 hypothetical protein [Ardenticatenaceae bacterium]MCB8990550.1 hypothetical protein [Ardenticatenaceae bacterium]